MNKAIDYSHTSYSRCKFQRFSIALLAFIFVHCSECSSRSDAYLNSNMSFNTFSKS